MTQRSVIIAKPQVSSTTDKNKEPFLVHCGDCSYEWAAGYLPMPLKTFAKLGKSPCPMCGSKKVLLGALPKQAQEGDAIGWLASGDTGISSETIWCVLYGRPDLLKTRLRSFDVPHDPDDFGRCYRLLKIMPSWRARLPEVAAVFPAWKPLVDAWDELTALYEEELSTGRAPKLYQRMIDLRR